MGSSCGRGAFGCRPGAVCVRRSFGARVVIRAEGDLVANAGSDFLRCPGARVRGSGRKPLRLDGRGKFPARRTVRCWRSCPELGVPHPWRCPWPGWCVAATPRQGLSCVGFKGPPNPTIPRKKESFLLPPPTALCRHSGISRDPPAAKFSHTVCAFAGLMCSLTLWVFHARFVKWAK